MAKLESQLINLVFFLIFLPFNFLDCLRQHNNCGSLGSTVAFLFELLPYAKGESGLWKDKLDSTPPTRDSSPSTRFPGEESVPHPESLDQACLHHPPTGRTSLAVHGSFDCRWYVHRGGFIPGLNPQDNFYLEGGKGSSSSLQNCHWSDNSEGRKKQACDRKFIFCFWAKWFYCPSVLTIVLCHFWKHNARQDSPLPFRKAFWSLLMHSLLGQNSWVSLLGLVFSPE